MVEEVKKTTAKKPAAKKATEKTAEVKVETKKAPAPKKSAGNKKANYTERLRERYNDEIVKTLMNEFKYESIMEVPHIEKIVINVGAGDAAANAKVIEDVVAELTQIAGQKPVVTKAKNSIANFKLREGQAIGAKVTLRGNKMYAFLDKLVSIALPRVRDFRGVNRNAFDGRGNYTLGVKEQLIFPEINYDKISKIRGMDIVIVTTANTDDEAFRLLELIGMPFTRKENRD